MLVDAECNLGSVFTIMERGVWERLGKSPLIAVNLNVNSASGHSLKLKGSFLAHEEASGKKTNIEVMVTKDNQLGVLFGTRALDVVMPTWRHVFFEAGCHTVAGGMHEAFLKQVRSDFTNVFDDRKPGNQLSMSWWG